MPLDGAKEKGEGDERESYGRESTHITDVDACSSSSERSCIVGWFARARARVREGQRERRGGETEGEGFPGG